MSKEALESWLDKAMQDRQVSFQSVLLMELDRDWELEALKEELDRQRPAEYEGYGITRDGMWLMTSRLVSRPSGNITYFG